MDAPQEFQYRLEGRAGGLRPGTHRGATGGTGLEFLVHARLFERPDPRRLDLRASIADLGGDWLVRVDRQRADVAVRLVADVSTSMRFGTPSKLERVAAFAQALGRSAFRVGDPVGMFAFDARVREDLVVPPRHRRGVGDEMAALLRACACRAGGIAGLRDAAERLGGRAGLVFLASDFHWPLADLGVVLDMLAPSQVLPIVVWDAAETRPPERDAVAMLSDAETGERRTLWLRPRLRARWHAAVAQRRETLARLFADRGMRPFHMGAAFDAQALSNHFLEVSA
jgi:hypothetical protein